MKLRSNTFMTPSIYVINDLHFIEKLDWAFGPVWNVAEEEEVYSINPFNIFFKLHEVVLLVRGLRARNYVEKFCAPGTFLVNDEMNMKASLTSSQLQVFSCITVRHSVDFLTADG